MPPILPALAPRRGDTNFGALQGRNRWQSFDSPKAGKWVELAPTVATGCHLLPFGSHGKQGVCGGLPPVAAGPLPAREEVDLQTLGQCPTTR